MAKTERRNSSSFLKLLLFLALGCWFFYFVQVDESSTLILPNRLPILDFLLERRTGFGFLRLSVCLVSAWFFSADIYIWKFCDTLSFGSCAVTLDVRLGPGWLWQHEFDVVDAFLHFGSNSFVSSSLCGSLYWLSWLLYLYCHIT